MAEDLITCPVCESETEFEPLAGGPHRAVRCRSCSLGIELSLSRNPAGAYARPVYDLARNDKAGLSRWARFHHDSAVAQLRLAQLSPVLPRPQPGAARPVWVDVGCGNGAHLAAARRRGWAVVGVEADAEAARELSELLAVPALAYGQWAATANNAPPAADAVSFFDVLEHLLDPVGTLQLAARSLRPGGVLVVEAPDLDSTTPEDFAAGKWRHRRVTTDFTEHVWHFSRRSLATLAARHLPGLEEVRSASPVPTKLQLAWRRRAE